MDGTAPGGVGEGPTVGVQSLASFSLYWFLHFIIGDIENMLSPTHPGISPTITVFPSGILGTMI